MFNHGSTIKWNSVGDHLFTTTPTPTRPLTVGDAEHFYPWTVDSSEMAADGLCHIGGSKQLFPLDNAYFDKHVDVGCTCRNIPENL